MWHFYAGLELWIVCNFLGFNTYNSVQAAMRESLGSV